MEEKNDRVYVRLGEILQLETALINSGVSWEETPGIVEKLIKKSFELVNDLELN